MHGFRRWKFLRYFEVQSQRYLDPLVNAMYFDSRFVVDTLRKLNETEGVDSVRRLNGAVDKDILGKLNETADVKSLGRLNETAEGNSLGNLNETADVNSLGKLNETAVGDLLRKLNDTADVESFGERNQIVDMSFTAALRFQIEQMMDTYQFMVNKMTEEAIVVSLDFLLFFENNRIIE